MTFDERLKIIWDEPNKHVTEVSTDSATIADVEATLGVKLPEDYLTLIKLQNGGYFNWFNHCDGADWDASELWGIRAVGDRDWEELKDHMAEESIDTPRDIDGLYPFAGNGHVHICFDYRGLGDAAEPSIAFIDIECFDTDRKIANSFREYIEKLEHESPYIEYAIETYDAAAESIIAPLEEIFGISFEDQSKDYNADTFRACYPSISNWKNDLPFDWIWLRRCKSKSGFHSCFQVPSATWFVNIGNTEVPESLIAKFETELAFNVTKLYKP
ncbi:MAG TPA: SMI1/KNR4 family protein, partial [Opitutaceae bacterium]|nr:SMI1/KNR4 family protein [Opitutaceae bacterium]